MQGILILLLSFFAVCWTLVIGYHTGLFMNVSHLESFTRGTMPLAYTGAALSVCTVGAIVCAAVLYK